tara:strand:+ start:647 stop:2308 length:1662 start_codon:yes stop_codon:yes gene_type:complete
MANGLLDLENFDYNAMIDKALGTTNQPFKGLINDPNYNSSLNVDTGIGALLGYYNSLYQGKTPIEKGLAAATGAKGARTKGINDYVQNILTQQKYSKNMLDMTKTQGELRQQPLDLLIKGFKAKEAPMDYELKQYDLEKAPLDLILKRNEANLSTSNINGLRNLSSTLPPKEQQKLVTMGAKAYYEMNKLSNEEKIFYQSIGVNDIFNIPNDKVDIIREYNNTVPQADADAHNAKQDELAFQYPTSYVPKYIDGKNDFSKKIANGNNNNLNQEPTNSSRNVQKQIGFQEINGEQIFVAMDNKRFTQEEYDNLGTEEAYLYEQTDRDSFNQAKKDFNTMNGNARKITTYGVGQNRKMARTIEKVLNNPKALRALFDSEGRLKVKINEMTDGWFAELGGEAQDIKNFIEVIKNKEFDNNITNMRNSSPTGGAVGNVSDKEVAMFKSMGQFLDYTGSGGNMYEALKDLYGQSQELQQQYEEAYILDFGQKNFSKAYIKNNLHSYKTFGADGDYADTLPDAVTRSQLNNPTTYINPKTDMPLEQQIQFGLEFIKDSD